MFPLKKTISIPEVGIRTSGKLELFGELTIPESSLGVILFAHGSGSSRLSPRNRFVAEILNHHHLATLLTDLLTEEESHSRKNVFDIELLAKRIGDIGLWLRENPETSELPIGLFGASTGAGAAVLAASENPKLFQTVVSRGGRIDMAHDSISQMKVPILAIVGERDDVVLDLNRESLKHCLAPHRLIVVPGATHLFEEAGCLEHVAEYSADWFVETLQGK